MDRPGRGLGAGGTADRDARLAVADGGRPGLVGPSPDPQAPTSSDGSTVTPSAGATAGRFRATGRIEVAPCLEMIKAPRDRALSFFLFASCIALTWLSSCTTTTIRKVSAEAGTDPTADPGNYEVPPAPPCEPSCKGRACGSDGCGGSCGACLAGEACNTNKGTCASTCTPSCDGLVCGSDGCGGSCGTCGPGTCHAGECQCAKDADCGANHACVQDTSGNHVCTPTCSLFDASSCGGGGKACSSFGVDGAGRYLPVCVPMGSKIEGDTCTDPPGFTGADCAPGLGCIHPVSSSPTLVCTRFCDAAHPCPKPGQTCTPLLAPYGAYSVCGPAMGPCAPNPCASPNRNCAGKNCGPNGCGGDCGVCAAGDTCKLSEQCCAPSCAGKICGPDGCGGSCGACGGGQICSPGGQCNVCVPSCAGKSCGPDGCGGSCGFCNFGGCDGAGQCVCAPSCAGKNCGNDGCGGSCGACGGGKTCAAGLCTDPNFCASAPCYAPFSDGGCCASSGFCVRAAGQANTFCRNTCGKAGEGCRGNGSCCNPLSCFANVCQ